MKNQPEPHNNHNMKENEGQEKLSSSKKVSEETLLAIYVAQWEDLHHSRNQDWKLCNLIIVGLLGIGGLKIFGELPNLQRIFSLVFAMVSLLAMGVTERHRILFKEKMTAIRKLEKLLNAPNLFETHSGWKNNFKVQYLLLIIYLLFGLSQ